MEIHGVEISRPDKRLFPGITKADLAGYYDVLRNAYAQTAVAPYAVRARPGAPVAKPLAWEQVADRRLRPDRFTLSNIDKWLAGDNPWSGLSRRARKLDRPRKRLAEVA